MESSEYKLMFELEEDYWWFRGLRDLIFSFIRIQHKRMRDMKILDVGCGTGINLKHYSGFGIPYGLDVSKEALEYCRHRGLTNTVNASATKIPFEDGMFDFVISTDVVCCIAPREDQKAFSEMERVLKPGGILILNVPAHDYLRRLQDDNAHVKHRYSIKEIREKVSESGLEPIKISYRNAFSYFILLASKFVMRNDKLATLRRIWAPLNAVMYFILKTENIALRVVNMPFGSSIFCVARKK